MRSQSYQIEPAKMRFTSDFTVSRRENSNSFIREMKQIKVFPGVRYGFVSSTGLHKGEGGEFSVQFSGAWRQISDTSTIIMRFFQDLYNEVLNKSFITFQHAGKKYSLQNILNVNGESIYMTADIEFTK